MAEHASLHGRWGAVRNPVMEHIEDEELLRRYLIAEVTPEQQEQIQERLFVDADFLDQLLSIENEMIEDYALGNLTLSQSELFELRFLRSPERRRRLKVARQLKTHAERTKKEAALVMRPRSSWKWMALNPRFVVTAAILILAALLLWLLRDRSLLKGQMSIWQAGQNSQQQQQERLGEIVEHLTDEQSKALALRQQVSNERQRAEQLERRINILEKQLSAQKQLIARQGKDSTGRTKPSLAELQPQPLWVGQGRGLGKPNLVRIPAGSSRVLLELVLEQDLNARYRVALKDANNRVLLNLNKLKPRASANGNSLMVGVPASVLPTGDYMITVQVVNAAGQRKRVDAYQFRVQSE